MQEKQVDLLEKSKENVRTPDGVPRLYDLIKVQDERMKLAFYAALGNTIVAKDLDQVDACLSIIKWICLVINFIIYMVTFEYLQGISEFTHESLDRYGVF